MAYTSISQEDLESQVDKDIQIKKSELDDESARTPRLHDKYLKLYLAEVKILKQMERFMAIILKSKTHYYLGKSDPDIYKKDPLDHRAIKSDLDIYLNADSEIQAGQQKIDDQEEKVKYLEKTVDKINQRGFQIRAIIDWQKFINGER